MGGACEGAARGERPLQRNREQRAWLARRQQEQGVHQHDKRTTARSGQEVEYGGAEVRRVSIRW